MVKTEEVKRYLKYQRKLRALRMAKEMGSVKYVCDLFGISKTTYFNWKRKYDKNGEKGLLRKKRESESYWNSVSQSTIVLILKLREEYKLGTWRIKWYLERYHDIVVSESTVYRTLKRNNIKPLDRTTTRRAMGPKRYSKDVPGRHVQVDVKFLTFSTGTLK